jgi:hypothetical protein
MTWTCVEDRTRKNKPVTRQVLENYFGQNASISDLAGWFEVTTIMGGKVKVSPGKITLTYGGDDVYRAVSLLIGECWAGAKVRGSREAILTAVAHSEAWGIRNIQPDVRSPWAVAWRWLVAVSIVVIGFKRYVEGTAHDHDGTFLVIIFAAMLVFRCMAFFAKRKEQRKRETGGFTAPQQTHGAAFADEESLRKAGLI